MKLGKYTAANSDLYIVVHTIHNISDRTGKIKMKATIRYKRNDEICNWMTPFGPKNIKLNYETVKSWEVYVK